MENKAVKIKFRGMSLDRGQYVYGYPYIKERADFDIAYILQESADDSSVVDLVRVDPSSVRQCTFIKDSAGNDIYDGDPVRYTSPDNKLLNGITVFHKGTFGFKSRIGGKDYLVLPSDVEDINIIRA